MTSLLYRIVNRHTGHRIAEYSEQLISSHTGASHINTAQLNGACIGFGDWGECDADDDDDFDEPGAWRDSMALGDCDA